MQGLLSRERHLEYINTMSIELKKMARDADEMFLYMLLDMVAIEARRCLSGEDDLKKERRSTVVSNSEGGRV